MSTIKNAIESVVGNDEEKKKAKEMLTLLAEACESKGKLMTEELKTYIRTAGTEENKTIPVSDILTEFFETRVTTSESIKDVPNAVADSIKNMMSGNIIEGATSLISTTLTAILGSSSGSEVTRKQYFVGIEGLSMVRYDISYWARDITVESLKKYQEKSCICILTKSSIDPKNLKFNTFLNIYQSLLEKKSGLTNDELIKLIQDAKKVYKTILDEEGTLQNGCVGLSDQCVTPIENLDKYLTTESLSFAPVGQWPCKI